MKRRRYLKLEVDRVDLVDRGANFDRESGDGSHILLVKRDPNAGTTEKQDLSCPSCGYSLPLGYGANGTKLPNYCPECGAKLTLRASNPSKQEPIMPAAAENQNDVTKRIADLEALVAKQAADNAAAIEAAVAKAKAEADAEKAALTKRVEDAEKATKAADDLAKAEVERREVAEATAVAKSFAGVGVTEADGPMFYRLSKVATKEDNERLHAILAAAAEQIRVGKLFAASGRPGEPKSGDANGNPEEVILAKAAELRKANPKLSEADSIDEACKLFPAERAAYTAYKRQQITGRPQ